MMPPKMLTRMPLTLGFLSMILKASVTFSVVAPPPTSRKLAGSAPNSLMVSHGRHCQTSAVHQTANIAVQGDVGQIELGGFDFVRILFIQIAILDDLGMTIEGVGIEVELGVQSLDGAVAFQDQRVDFRQGSIGFHVGGVQLLEGIHGLGGGAFGNADTIREVQGLFIGQAGGRINEDLEDLLGGAVSNFLDVHTAFAGSHHGNLLRGAVGQRGNVVFPS